MPKYNVKFQAANHPETRASYAADSPEEAVVAARAQFGPEFQLVFVSEAKRGRPPKVSLVPPDLM